MSINNPVSFFYKDAAGIRTDFPIGLSTPSVAGYDIAGGQQFIEASEIKTSTNIYIVPSTAPSSTEGKIYFDSTLHKLRIRGAAGWETVTSV